MLDAPLGEVEPDGLVFPAPRGGWARRSNCGPNLLDPAAGRVAWPRDPRGLVLGVPFLPACLCLLGPGPGGGCGSRKLRSVGRVRGRAAIWASARVTSSRQTSSDASETTPPGWSWRHSQTCRTIPGIDKASLPALWDADVLFAHDPRLIIRVDVRWPAVTERRLRDTARPSLSPRPRVRRHEPARAGAGRWDSPTIRSPGRQTRGSEPSGYCMLRFVGGALGHARTGGPEDGLQGP